MGCTAPPPRFPCLVSACNVAPGATPGGWVGAPLPLCFWWAVPYPTRGAFRGGAVWVSEGTRIPGLHNFPQTKKREQGTNSAGKRRKAHCTQGVSPRSRIREKKCTKCTKTPAVSVKLQLFRHSLYYLLSYPCILFLLFVTSFAGRACIFFSRILLSCPI